MSDYEIECLECMWSGRTEQLVCSEEDDESDKKVEEISFNVCPDCGASNCFEDIEEEEEAT